MRQRYPRTPHLPWSPGATPDDVRGAAFAFDGAQVVVTEKLDGENTTLLHDGLHARSPESAHHPSRTRMKALHARIASSLGPDQRICGENVSARHSLGYANLLGWFYALSVWDGDTARSWDETVSFAHARGLPTPRVLYRGPWDAKRIRKLPMDPKTTEGYVVRTVAGFERADFGQHVAKWVRPNHVRTDTHWMNAPVVWNQLGAGAVPWTLRSGGPLDLRALRTWLGTGSGEPYDRGGLGEARLEGLIASQLHQGLGERLPMLAHIGHDLAVRSVALAALHSRLSLRVDDATRAGGLVSLARSVDLRVLHGLALHHAEDPEPIRWSQLHAEEARLWERDPLTPWCARLRSLLPKLDELRWAAIRGAALRARSRGRLVSPDEAAALVHPLLQRPLRWLTVLVGPSGCGKSSLARDLGVPVISLDAARKAQKKAADAALVHRCLQELRSTMATSSAVWDATGITPTQRQAPLNIAHELGVATRIIAVLTPRVEAERRNQKRKVPVPRTVIERQWRRLRWPLQHEADVVEFR